MNDCAKKCLLLAAALWIAAPAAAGDAAPVRFALSFDDGPSGRQDDNPTEIVLGALDANTTQPGIKAVFFVMTHSSGEGASPRGRALLARTHQEGHVLALHDGSPYGHPSHRRLCDAELDESLRAGTAALGAVTGRPVTLLRPPYWAFDARTLAAYARHGLAMLLTDVSANDGKAWGFIASPRRRGNIAAELARVRARILRGDIAAADGVTPVIVTFHDINEFTAAHMREYLQILVDEARLAGIALASPPFYRDADALERALLARASDPARRDAMVPPKWRWIQAWFGGGVACP